MLHRVRAHTGCRPSFPCRLDACRAWPCLWEPARCTCREELPPWWTWRGERAADVDEGSEADKEKRPLSAFFAFSRDARPAVKAELPSGAPVGEVARALGERWRALGEGERATYEEAARGAMADYLERRRQRGERDEEG